MKMSNAALDRLAIRTDRRASYEGLAYRRFDQIGGAVRKRHIIKGIFARGETSFWYAPPGGMKSALMADAAVAVASGADWFGRRNKEACAVVYFALERADLVNRRLTALRLTKGLPDSLPIAVVSESINFKNPDSVAKVVATINEVSADYEVSVGLAIFDTMKTRPRTKNSSLRSCTRL
jgi:RecA-family ATPase